MYSAIGFSAVLTLVIFFGQLRQSLAIGSGTVLHWCSFDVYCAVVQGYNSSTPPSERAGVTWSKLPAGNKITVGFDKYGANDGVAMMCTSDPSASPILVTQLEFTWEPDQSSGLIYYDASNVAGEPFVDYGFKVDIVDAKDPDLKLNNCKTVYCAAADEDCDEAYEKWNDDLQAMRTCFDDALLTLTLCSG